MNVFASRNNINTAMADSATFTIISSSNWPGYCGNGSLPNESPILPSPDFSFEATSDLDEISGIINGDKLSAPIYCKDYGAWCEVAITLKKGGIPIQSEPIRLRIPRDANGDKIADCWQDQQNAEWNDQFKPTTPRPITPASRALVQPDLDDEDADSDGNNGGGRNLPAMAAPGDGLKIREEYRGFILDGGPNLAHFGDHMRLSIARKELLVECSVEDGLTSAIKNGTGTNQSNFAGFEVRDAMADVSSFYRDPDKGAAIDLYWAEDVVVQPGELVDYTNPDFPNRVGWEWNGAVQYLENTPTQGTVTVTGAGVPIRDYLWRKIDQDKHDEFYGSGLEKLQTVNRNPALGAFVKLLLPTRTGYLQGGLSGQGSSAVIDVGVSRYLGEAIEHSKGRPYGAHAFLAAISDEGISYYKDTLNRHFTGDEFNRLARRVIAHEVGHLIFGFDHTGIVSGDTLMDDSLLVLPDGSVRDLSTSKWHDDEVSVINLPGRYSIAQ